MKQAYLLLILTMISVAGFSQTKRIAHRSHSGKDLTFSIAGSNSADNFGLPPPKTDTIKKLQAKPLSKKDSLKLQRHIQDSLKKNPPKAVPDSLKQASTSKVVYSIISEIMDVCSR